MANKKSFKIDLGKAIIRLDIAIKRTMASDSLGFYKSAFKGQGLEFEEYQVYTSGEDSHRIDWKASARSPNILMKKYVEERNLKVFFLIDASTSMIFGSGNKLKNEYAAELILSLSHPMIEAGDLVGFAMFTDKITQHVLPVKDRSVHYQLSRALVDPDNYGSGYDLVSALDFVNTHISDQALLIIVSDFLGLKGKWEEKLKILANRFDIIAMMIRDTRDLKLPEDVGQVVIEDPFSGKQTTINPSQLKKLYSRVANQQVEKVKKSFIKINCDFVDFETDKPYVSRVVSFFRRRASKVS